MGFIRKTWKDQIAQFTNRYVVTPLSDGKFNIIRFWGNITQIGDKINAETMNDLEGRIEEADTTLDQRITDEIGSVNEALNEVENNVANINRGQNLQDKRIRNLEEASKGNLYYLDEQTEDKYIRDVPSNALPNQPLTMLGGKTVVWNQLVRNGDFSIQGDWYGDKSISYGINSATVVFSSGMYNHLIQSILNSPKNNNHKYYVIAELEVSSSLVGTEAHTIGFMDTSTQSSGIHPIFLSGRNVYKGIFAYTGLSGSAKIGVRTANGNMYENESMTVFRLMLVDLTKMFGVGNEPTTTDDPRIAYIEKYLEDHPQYNDGELVHASVDDVISHGKNLAYGVKYISASYWEACVTVESPFKFIKDKTYTISFDTPTSGNELYLPFYTDTYEGLQTVFCDGTRKSITTKFRNDVYDNRILLNRGSTSSTPTGLLSNLMIELSSSPTDYTPYFLKHKPLPSSVLSLPCYGKGVGTSYNQLNTVKQKFKGMISANAWELNWTYDSTNQRFRNELPNVKLMLDWNAINILSNIYPCIYMTSNGINKSCGIYNSTFIIKDDSFTDVATFKAYLEENKVVLHYEATEGGEDYDANIYNQKVGNYIITGNEDIFISQGSQENVGRYGITLPFSNPTRNVMSAKLTTDSWATSDMTISQINDNTIYIQNNAYVNNLSGFTNWVRGLDIVFELATPREYDVTELLKDFDNYIVTEPNGTIELHNTNGMAIDVPSTIAYGLKVEV